MQQSGASSTWPEWIRPFSSMIKSGTQWNASLPPMIPRRIAYVLKVFPKISETFIASELIELRRRGIELRILSQLPPRQETRHEMITSAGLDQLVSYGPKEFSAILSQVRPQLLHAHFATAPTAMAI